MQQTSLNIGLLGRWVSPMPALYLPSSRFHVVAIQVRAIFCGKASKHITELFHGIAAALSAWGRCLLCSVLILKDSVAIMLKAYKQSRFETITMMAMSGVIIEKTVNPYEAYWKTSIFPSLSVASPTCMAVSTIVTYTKATKIQPKLRFMNLSIFYSRTDSLGRM